MDQFAEWRRSKVKEGALRPFTGPMGLAVPAGRDNFWGNSTCPNSMNCELARLGRRYSIDAGPPFSNLMASKDVPRDVKTSKQINGLEVFSW
jgi:hypothetical protein